MKKTLSLMLALLLVCSLTACVRIIDDEIIPPATDGSQSQETTVPQDAEETQPTDQAVSGEATVHETVLVDEAGIKITAKELATGGLFGPELKLLIENNTDKNLTFQSQSCSVNGYMVESIMSVDVAAGKKANDSLTFMGSSLEDCGIQTIADMEFSFYIFHTDDWSEYLSTAPVQLKTSTAETFEYTYDETGTLVYDANGVKIVAKGLATNDSLLGPGLVVYIHNTTAGSVTVQANSCSLNGFMVDPIFSQNVDAGKRSVSAITFMDTQLQENGITEITEVELSFYIFDTNSWGTIAESEPITLNFNQ